ncbi:alpha/beta fold hydrolase [Hufsiella ginkgonis]|uniref:Alpha/beta fold hydrolase n=1 Tax=Hufsiella ginkgonis TaxID=2695274 RepID=A0A7K1Y2P5_9SPHI|nr:alpha/beta fold hydrolase [Hufsiella ginkgonis]MXV16956.1 alpha/beta fold hydrolase [Hufsiella ginkgonis]
MKKIITVLLFLFVANLSYAQGIITLINKSNEFFDLLDKGKYEDAHAFFDDSVKTKISADALKGFWTSITGKLGAFESVDGAQNRSQGDFFVVTLNCRFRNDSQAFQFAWNKSERIAGFFVVPKSTAPVYAKPAYADTALYTEKMVSVKTPGHELAALLTVPRNVKNFPVVVFVHGSGPSDMDESIGPNKPFKDIATGLASKGIGSIRYVKRTLVYAAEFSKLFTVKEEVLDDAVAAIALAKTIPDADPKKIYLFGHSLGGMLAPRIAGLAPDLKGIIMAAAPARKFTDVLLEQNKYMFDQRKDTTAAARRALKEDVAYIEKSRVLRLGAMKPDSAILGLPAAYWIDMNTNDQVAAAKRYPGRILVIQGGNDFQVSVKDFDLWKTALSLRKNANFKFYPRLNHLLSPQTEKGTTDQYALMTNVADYVINETAAWIKAGL